MREMGPNAAYLSCIRLACFNHGACDFSVCLWLQATEKLEFSRGCNFLRWFDHDHKCPIKFVIKIRIGSRNHCCRTHIYFLAPIIPQEEERKLHVIARTPMWGSGTVRRHTLDKYQWGGDQIKVISRRCWFFFSTKCECYREQRLCF